MVGEPEKSGIVDKGVLILNYRVKGRSMHDHMTSSLLFVKRFLNLMPNSYEVFFRKGGA